MRKKKVEELINQEVRITASEISERLDIPYRSLMVILNDLVDEGKVARLGKPPKVLYIPGDASTISDTLKRKLFKVTKKQQRKELDKRVPPVLNVGVIIYNNGKFLVGKRSSKKYPMEKGLHIFPGGREYFEESPQEAAERILAEEVPGVEANLRRMITALYDKGYDKRAYNVVLYYLFDYVGGDPQPSEHFEDLNWFTKKEILNLDSMHPVEKQLFIDLEKEIRWMNSNQDEILLEVDENDEEIGKIVKRVAHTDPNRFHRAAHIVIFNSNNEVVLHKRSMAKDTRPGYWDFFGGHQLHGQTIKQTAKHELFEELGVDTNLKFHSKRLTELSNQSEFGYLYWGVHDGPYSWDPNEVDEIKSFNVEKLLNNEYEGILLNELVPIYLNKLKDVWKK